MLLNRSHRHPSQKSSSCMARNLLTLPRPAEDYVKPRKPFHQEVGINGNSAIYTAYVLVNINNPGGESVNETGELPGFISNRRDGG